MTKAEPADPTRKIDTVEKEVPPVRTRYDWAVIADTLRKEPMEWFVIFKGGRAAISNAISQGNITDVHPDLGFEVLTTNNKRTSPRTCDLYLRYNPDRESDLRAVLTNSRKKK